MKFCSLGYLPSFPNNGCCRPWSFAQVALGLHGEQVLLVKVPAASKAADCANGGEQ